MSPEPSAANYYLGGNSANPAISTKATNTYDSTKNNIGAFVGLAQRGVAQTETGFETRGRIDVDARTATSMGTARTYLRLRAANTSGSRNPAFTNNAVSTPADASATAITIESAFVQWAGFTFGVAPENFGFMPSFMYTGNPWTGFPSGMKQLAYTATLGGGLSATIALEDRLDSFQGSSTGAAGGNYLDRAATAANLVANVRLDQSWGFAVLSGMVGNNSVSEYFGYNPNVLANSTMTTSALGAGLLGSTNSYVSTFTNPTQTSGLYSVGSALGTNSPGQKTMGAWAVGGTVSFKLPMIAAGDQIWLNANYGNGMLGATQGAAGMNNLSTSSVRRLIGGIQRVDNNIMVTGGDGSFASPYTVGTVTSWNVGAAFTHYWAKDWRSNFSAGYMQVNTPTSTARVVDAAGNAASLPQWGKGSIWEVAGGLIYTPAKDFDIGLEIQYASMTNKIQNTATASCVMTTTSACTASALTIPDAALKGSNITTKLRVERAF